MGSVVFTDTHSSYGVASATYDVKVTYSETFNSSTMKTTVRVTGVSIRKRGNTTNWGINPVFGTIQINGTTVMTLSGGSAHTCHLSGSDYCSVTIPTSGSVEISHNAITGKASMSVKVIAGNNDYFCMYHHTYSPGTDDIYLYAGVPTTTKSNIELTTRASSLAVNPDGGTWNGSTSVQTFSQAQGSTKEIANPTKNGYAFAGWVLTGGGSISGTTYTFGSTNGTLIASWVNAEYTLTINADSGSDVHVTKNDTELFNGDSIYYNDVLTLSIMAKPGYQMDSRSPDSDTITVSGNLTVSCVTSPMATIHIRKNGSWGMYLIYIRRNAQWLLHQANIRKNAQWKKYY